MAANHIFGLGDVVATTATVVAILAVSAMPLHARQPSTVQLNADAQNLFKIISSDKLKIQIFCKIAVLGDQLDQADQVHDTKKVEEVSQKLDEWHRAGWRPNGPGSEFRRRSGDWFDNLKA